MLAGLVEVALVSGDHSEHGVAREGGNIVDAVRGQVEALLGELPRRLGVAVAPRESGRPRKCLCEELRVGSCRALQGVLQVPPAFGEFAPKPPEAPESSDQSELET